MHHTENNSQISSDELHHLQQMAIVDTSIIACANTLLEEGAESIGKLLKILTEFFSGDCAYVFERNPSNFTATISYSYSTPENTTTNGRDFSKSYPYSPNSQWSKELLKNPYVFLQANQVDQSYFPYDDSFFSVTLNKNFLIGPLMKDGEILGVIGVNNLKKNLDYVQLINTIISFVSNSLIIRNTKLSLEATVTHLEKQNEHNQAMLECVTTLVSENQLDSSLRKLLQIICNYYNGSSSYILIQKEENPKLLSYKYAYLNKNTTEPSYTPDVSFASFNSWYELYEQDGVAYVPTIAGDFFDRFHDSHAFKVIRRKRVRSFLASPLTHHEVHTGFLWIDNPSKNIEETTLLSAISSFIINHLSKDELLKELESLSYSDTLTGLYNRNYYFHYIERLERSSTQNIGIVFADVNGLKKANDNFGHEYGDILLKWSANFFAKHTDGLVFRIGGDEFLCIYEEIGEAFFYQQLDAIRDSLNTHGDVHISIGGIWTTVSSNLEEHIKEADNRMYLEKQKYYESLKLDPRSITEELADYQQSILALKDDF
ncbi:MAG: GGDEF domain-containing protein [Eubacteriales bacterium]